jgi:predicted secreted protein
MRLREPDGSRHLTVALDDVIELELQDIPGAGYLWQLEVTGPLSIAAPRGETEEAILSGPVGAGAFRQWRVVPTGVGQGVVSGERGQPWEPEQRDRAFTLTVNVISAGHRDGGRPRSEPV